MGCFVNAADAGVFASVVVVVDSETPRSDYRSGKFISSARRASDWSSIDMPAAQIRLILAGCVWELVGISAVHKKTQRLMNPLLLI